MLAAFGNTKLPGFTLLHQGQGSMRGRTPERIHQQDQTYPKTGMSTSHQPCQTTQSCQYEYHSSMGQTGTGRGRY